MMADVGFLHQIGSPRQNGTMLFIPRMSPKPLKPSVPIKKVHLGLSVFFTAAYGLLFLHIYWQLWLILHYGHRRLSYQSIFLFACLFWAALRTTLFSFYFKNCAEANEMAPFFYWLLFAFPVFLQYFMLNILVLYFVQVRKLLGLVRYVCVAHCSCSVVATIFHIDSTSLTFTLKVSICMEEKCIMCNLTLCRSFAKNGFCVLCSRYIPLLWL